MNFANRLTHHICNVTGLALSRAEPAEVTRAEPKISESQAERARGLAHSLGSPFCNIHFIPNSIKLCQLYVTKLLFKHLNCMLQAILARIDEDSINLSRRGEGHQISDEAGAGLGHPRNRRGEDEIATILASK